MIEEGTGDAMGLALDNPINEARYYAYNEAALCSGAKVSSAKGVPLCSIKVR